MLDWTVLFTRNKVLILPSGALVPAPGTTRTLFFGKYCPMIMGNTGNRGKVVVMTTLGKLDTRLLEIDEAM